MSEKEFIEKLKIKDEVSWELLFSKYQKRLYRSVYLLIHNEDDALDIVNETLIKVFENISKFRGDSNLFTWIYRIAYNLSLKHLKQKKLFSFIENITDIFSISNSVPGSDIKLIMKEELNLLVKQIEKLPVKLKAVLILRHFEELSYQEIAEAVGCNVGTVKSRLYTAREHLAVKLEDIR